MTSPHTWRVSDAFAGMLPVVIDDYPLKVQIDLKASERLLYLVPHLFHRQPQLIKNRRLVFCRSEDSVVTGLQQVSC